MRIACPPSAESFYASDASLWQPPTKQSTGQSGKIDLVEELDADDEEDENEEKASASVKS